MDEELRERLKETSRLVEEIREEGRKGELARVRFAHFHAYAAGQYEAWATVIRTINDLKASPTKDEEDAKLDDPSGEEEGK